MNHNDTGDPLTSHLAISSGQDLILSETLVYDNTCATNDIPNSHMVSMVNIIPSKQLPCEHVCMLSLAFTSLQQSTLTNGFIWEMKPNLMCENPVFDTCMQPNLLHTQTLSLFILQSSLLP